MRLLEMQSNDILILKAQVLKEYDEFKSRGLKLDMSRGKPSPDQLDLSADMLNMDVDSWKTQSGFDCRNYGLLDGIPEAKALFADVLGVLPEEVFIYGNASLTAMYDCVARAMTHGIMGSKAWCKYDKVKFLCPVPGYDRHFAICEHFGIEMINIPLSDEGPDMDMIEKLVAEDETIKGIWCIPQYANPTGVVYSDATVKRFAALKPKAEDFRIFWDNAYCIHHLTENPKIILNIMDECKKLGNENMVYMFASTSKISFSGAGIAAMAASADNMSDIKKQMTIATIGFDKINQLRHVKYFGNLDGLKAHMRKHTEIIRPKFDAVLNELQKEIAPLGIGSWHHPQGGYFISFDTLDGCAKRVVQLCREAGVVLTGAGATYPYGKDSDDKNIRIAPTYPSVDELKTAMELFCICVKLASIEKVMEENLVAVI